MPTVRLRGCYVRVQAWKIRGSPWLRSGLLKLGSMFILRIVTFVASGYLMFRAARNTFKKEFSAAAVAFGGALALMLFAVTGGPTGLWDYDPDQSAAG